MRTTLPRMGMAFFTTTRKAKSYLDSKKTKARMLFVNLFGGILTLL